MMLRHRRRRHGKQHAVGVDQADLLAVAHEGDRLALHHGDAQLVGQHAHDRGVLDPGNLFQLLAPLVQGNKEDVAADVFAEDGQQVAARDFGQAGGLNVAGAGDAEARVALEIRFEDKAGGDENAGRGEHAAAEKDASPLGRRPPPGAALRALPCAGVASPANSSSSSSGSGMVSGRPQIAPRRRCTRTRDLLSAADTGIRRRFIVPGEQTVFRTALSGHA